MDPTVPGRWPGVDQRILQTLMIPLAMIVLDELGHRSLGMPFAQQDHPVETFLLDRPHKPLVPSENIERVEAIELVGGARYRFASPALFRPMHNRFVAAVDAFVTRYDIPRVTFEPGQDKDALVAGYRARFKAREGVVILGVAQEKMRAFKGHKQGRRSRMMFTFSRQWVAVNHYYFYVLDRDWGPGLPEDRHV